MKQWLRRTAAAFFALVLVVTSASALSPGQARELLDSFYIDPLPDAAYRAETLDELIAALGDPYTYYMDAAEYAAFTQGVESETTIVGIGAGIRYTERGIELVSVYAGSGAEDAGLRAGDVILAIDGVSCVPGSEQHRDRILGAEGSTVMLTVQSADGTVRDRRVTRRAVVIHNTTVHPDGDAVTIECASFGSQTAAYFRQAVEKYGSTASAWLIDLRSNPGGLTQSAVDALSVFAGSGNHLYLLDRNDHSSPERSLDKQLTDRPAIVLINGDSASAAEILAGGIRAARAGVLVGTRSYGKGTAQIVLDEQFSPTIFHGDALRLTAYRFYNADGNTPDVFGVLPTLPVDDALSAQAAKLLAARRPETGDSLKLTLCGWDFFVDLADARKAENAAAFSALLAALPPQAKIECSLGDQVSAMDARQAAAACGVSYTGRWFSDVSSSKYASAINALATQNILHGDDGARFRPGATLTRAELCAMLAQAMDLTAVAGSAFSDVHSRDWFAAPVSAMAALGLVRGVGGGRFDPNATLTQEQFFTIMGRFAAMLNFRFREYDRILGEQGLTASLVPDAYASWARADAGALSSYVRDAHGTSSTMLVDELTRIPPREAVTREQAAATLYNVLSGLGILVY